MCLGLGPASEVAPERRPALDGSAGRSVLVQFFTSRPFRERIVAAV